MSEVSVDKANRFLLELLGQVQKGERFIITDHGVPVAELVPVRKKSHTDVRAAIEGLKTFQAMHDLDGLSLRALRETGRK